MLKKELVEKGWIIEMNNALNDGRDDFGLGWCPKKMELFPWKRKTK